MKNYVLYKNGKNISFGNWSIRGSNTFTGIFLYIHSVTNDYSETLESRSAMTGSKINIDSISIVMFSYGFFFTCFS